MKIYKNYTAEPYSCSVNDTNLPSDNPLRFRNILMNLDDQIKDEKFQYNINREAAKIPALSSSKIDKYVFHTGEEIFLLIKNRAS